ncbi:MAG TPA: MarR family transcriptional regulator [Solirubrobacteraceae bacterium]|nr:MarR family transcriptional regulator [Solirubrobacteraceae bacterium]
MSPGQQVAPVEDDAGLVHHNPRLIYAIGRLDRVVRRELTTRLAPVGLTWPQYTTLSVLDAKPGLSNAQLARRAMISPQAMSEVTTSLERMRLLERRVSPTNNRILRARLTAKGRRLLADCEARVDELERQMLDGISERESQRLLEAIRSCVRHLGGGL